ncbi:hypothetical protein OS122_02600 [Mycolicibacterium mucogenicum]|uniref:TylF/MycF/NovP-related O-methyltransferase n=1 Tax=Mycolicibacterium mucogenicum TaxID=56689 RepID=UPI002269C79B|nr:TylF/MycF/NovP-related O-methyltransferase [Mycolicibacterium mucogenicum]MCX8559789.1 hypothetical protein [Mycolicibacterium mucogenicum]
MTVTLRDYDLGPRAPQTGGHYELLQHVLTLNPTGLALEFGVGRGESTSMIAAHMPVIGFDSWLGLPENWRPGFPKGMFASMPPSIANTDFVDGWYEDTLPDSLEGVREVGLVHIDCDLYSSTATVLAALSKHRILTTGTFVVFDEWHGYDECELHEQRAWREFTDDSPIGWRVVGHGHESWSIQIA